MEKTTKTIQLGNTSLEVNLQTLDSKEQSESIKTLEGIASGTFNPTFTSLSIEKELLKELQDKDIYKINKIKANLVYPQIQDFSFLSDSNEIDYKGNKISVPKLGVYSLNNNTFSVEIKGSGGYDLVAPLFTAGVSIFPIIAAASTLYLGAMKVIDVGIRELVGIPVAGFALGGLLGISTGYLFNHLGEKEVRFQDIPKTFSDQLIKSMGFFPHDDYGCFYNGLGYSLDRMNLSKEILKKYKKIGDIELTSTLHCLVPAETQERIKKAKEIFKNNLYFIAEAKPDEWNVRKIAPRDPLVVGLIDNQGYLIDKFDPTDLESYICQNSRNYNTNSEN